MCKTLQLTCALRNVVFGPCFVPSACYGQGILPNICPSQISELCVRATTIPEKLSFILVRIKTNNQILVGIDSQGNIIHGVVTYVILVAYVVSTPFQSVLPPKGLSGGEPQFTSEAMK